jgi:hypothetical protein
MVRVTAYVSPPERAVAAVRVSGRVSLQSRGGHGEAAVAAAALEGAGAGRGDGRERIVVIFTIASPRWPQPLVLEVRRGRAGLGVVVHRGGVAGVGAEVAEKNAAHLRHVETVCGRRPSRPELPFF